MLYYRKAKLYLQFWRHYSKEKLSRGKKSTLVRSIFIYTVKARCFARIKLYNYTNRKVCIC